MAMKTSGPTYQIHLLSGKQIKLKRHENHLLKFRPRAGYLRKLGDVAVLVKQNHTTRVT